MPDIIKHFNIIKYDEMEMHVTGPLRPTNTEYAALIKKKSFPKLLSEDPIDLGWVEFSKVGDSAVCLRLKELELRNCDGRAINIRPGFAWRVGDLLREYERQTGNPYYQLSIYLPDSTIPHHDQLLLDLSFSSTLHLVVDANATQPKAAQEDEKNIIDYIISNPLCRFSKIDSAEIDRFKPDRTAVANLIYYLTVDPTNNTPNILLKDNTTSNIKTIQSRIHKLPGNIQTAVKDHVASKLADHILFGFPKISSQENQEKLYNQLERNIKGRYFTISPYYVTDSSPVLHDVLNKLSSRVDINIAIRKRYLTLVMQAVLSDEPGNRSKQIQQILWNSLVTVEMLPLLQTLMNNLTGPIDYPIAFRKSPGKNLLNRVVGMFFTSQNSSKEILGIIEDILIQLNRIEASPTQGDILCMENKSIYKEYLRPALEVILKQKTKKADELISLFTQSLTDHTATNIEVLLEAFNSNNKEFLPYNILRYLEECLKKYIEIVDSPDDSIQLLGKDLVTIVKGRQPSRCVCYSSCSKKIKAINGLLRRIELKTADNRRQPVKITPTSNVITNYTVGGLGNFFSNSLRGNGEEKSAEAPLLRQGIRQGKGLAQ